MRNAQAGNQAAFGELMKRHHERTYRLVYSVVRHEHDARDVAQEVWLTVWRQLAKFRGDAQFSTWLHPIAVRRSLDHLRKRRRWYDIFLPLDITGEDGESHYQALSTPDQSDDKGKGERIAKVREALKTLPPKLRAVLALRELEGLSYEQIAAAMKIPSGTVMSRIYHARRVLAKKLGPKL
uniref:sigma-70 family RNA polymerase sigma factor n=2 Tax=Cephaloticoccus sp. TaxID=1985742 RepID=UPI00404AC3F9